MSHTAIDRVDFIRQLVIFAELPAFTAYPVNALYINIISYNDDPFL